MAHTSLFFLNPRILSQGVKNKNKIYIIVFSFTKSNTYLKIYYKSKPQCLHITHLDHGGYFSSEQYLPASFIIQLVE